LSFGKSRGVDRGGRGAVSRDEGRRKIRKEIERGERRNEDVEKLRGRRERL
jgi:hypothetical protein